MTDLRASVREVVDHMGTAGYGKNSQTLADRKSVYEAMAEDVKLSSDSEDIQKIITNWEESEKISKEFADEFDVSHKKLEKSLPTKVTSSSSIRLPISFSRSLRGNRSKNSAKSIRFPTKKTSMAAGLWCASARAGRAGRRTLRSSLRT